MDNKNLQIIKNKLDNNLFSEELIKKYYVEDEKVLIRDDIKFEEEDIFNNIKKTNFGRIGTIDSVFLDGLGNLLVDVKVPRKRYNFYWSYKQVIPIKMIEDLLKPTYKTKNINRTLNEKIITDDILITESIKPETLTINQQKERFKEGDIVYIRKDSFDIFNDIDPDGMNIFLGTFGKIIHVQTSQEIYGRYNTNRANPEYGIMEPTDLVLNIINPNDPYSESWYWWYKCLINPNFLKPSYKPKRINRVLERFNDIEHADEICIQLNNKNDYQNLLKLINDNNIRLNIISKLDDNDINRRLDNGERYWVFIPLDLHRVSQLHDNDWVDYNIDNNFNNIDFLDRVWNKVLDVNYDYNIIVRCLRDGEIPSMLPSYKPKKIIREL